MAIDLVARALSDVRHELGSQGHMRLADAHVGDTLTEENSFVVDHDLDLASIELAMAIVAKAGGKFDCPLDDLARDDYIRHVLGHDNPAVLSWDEARERRRQVQECHRRLSDEGTQGLSARLLRALQDKPGEEHWHQVQRQLLGERRSDELNTAPAVKDDANLLEKVGDFQIRSCCSEGRVFLERISTAEGTEVRTQEVYAALAQADKEAALGQCFEDHF